ncbi:MAG: hypothetical protein JJU36_02105 [Phycisphaeraceae bacterium]|nr:hypothetical protein [Phycisphaeraceae bacterium]
MARTPALFMLLMLPCVVACSGFQLTDPVADPQSVAVARTLVYPDRSDRGPDLDIAVQQRGRELRIINRTPRQYSGLQIWLNRQYVAVLDRIDIGANPAVGMNRFVNVHGEPFPTPGLLTPERGQRLVLAEVFDPDTGLRHALWVQVEPEG